MADVQQEWGRVTAWLEQHAPDVFAALGGRGRHAAISAAEARMGVELPADLRRWLLANDPDAGRHPDDHAPLVALGRPGVLSGGGLLLGLTDIERVHRHKMEMEEDVYEAPR